MSADELFDGFDLEGLREFRNGVEGLRDAAIRTTGATDAEIEAAGRITGYNKVLAELERRIRARKAC